MRVSWPLRGTMRDTQTTTGRVPRPHRSRTAGPPAPGWNSLVSTPGASRVIRSYRGLGQRPAEPQPGVLPQVGDRIHGVADAPQHGAGARQGCPACLVAVGYGHQPPGTRPAQLGREQAERRGRAEHHRVTALALDDAHRAAGDRRHGEHQRGRMTDYREGLPGVELAAPSQAGAYTRDVLRRQAQRQGVHEELDPARPRREIVGDEEDFRHDLTLPASRVRRR